ncbi:hypothetical protein [Rhodococcus rhodochrous]|uniref:hypothetical protein n=1 Tax=Rhodococcus rhodochrous TaxID=1829 RepID=UPI000A83216E|nr:hypothetical protein [Rhodococcus rhodochrous]
MQWIAVIAIVLLVGLVLTFWKAILGALAVLVLAGVALWAWQALRSRAKGRRDQAAALAARADREHALFLEGKDAGVYGRYSPIDLDRPRPTPLPATMTEWREQRRRK